MEIIKLSQKQIRYLKCAVEREQASQIGFEQACFSMKRSKENLVKKIDKLFPNAANQDKELAWKTKELIIDNI